MSALEGALSPSPLVPPAGPPRPFSPPPFASRTLRGGPSFRAARWGARPVFSAAVLLPGAGSVGEPPGEQGVSDLVADLLAGGTRRRDARELAEALDDLAVALDVSAGFDATIVRLSSLTDTLRPALALLSELVTEPVFPEDEVERCRSRQIDALAEQRTEPDFLARERLLAALFPGHPYGRLAPPPESLAALPLEALRAFHARAYSLGTCLVALAGSLPEDELLEAAEEVFGQLVGPSGVQRPAAPVPGASGVPLTVEIVDRPGSVQTSLVFGRQSLRRSDPRYLPALVANQSLGGGAASRLFHVLREERGLTYGAFSGLVARREAGHFMASIDCRTEVTREAATGLLELLDTFSRTGPDAVEHERSCRFLDGTFVLARETPGSLVHDEVIRVLYGLPADEWSSFRRRVSAVTREEAREAARELFEPKTGVLVAVGEAEPLRRALGDLGPVTVRDQTGCVV